MIPRTLWIGACITGVFAIAALLSFLWTPFDHTQLAIANKLKEPSLTHWFGTDHFGRDIFTMIMVGARTSIAVAVVAVGSRVGSVVVTASKRAVSIVIDARVAAGPGVWSVVIAVGTEGATWSM